MYCKQYPKHGQSSSRFTFFFKKNLDFNFKITIDIIYIEDKLVFYLVDKITCF